VTVSQPRERVVLLLLLIYVVILLAVGLNPRNLARHNDVTWLPDQAALRFDGHGLAFTDSPATAAVEPIDAFTLLVDLRLMASDTPRGFEHVVTLFGHAADSQLLIGQWKDSLIVTNGADYDYRQRRPRLSASLNPGDGQWHVLAVTVDRDGTRLFVDGLETAAMAQRLTLPAADGRFRLLLGNSVHGNQGWKGLIRGVALLRRAMHPTEIATVATGSRKLDTFVGSGAEQPELLFSFAEGQDEVSGDLGARALPLSFPRDRVILEPEFFQPGFRDARLGDVIVNLFGFVPFGILGALALLGRGVSRAATLVVVVAAGAVLSGSIELAQAWMPMRSSSVLDLLLNTSGTFGGTLGCLLLSPHVVRLIRAEGQRPS